MTSAGHSLAAPPGLAYRMALSRNLASDNKADRTENEGSDNDGSFSPNDDEEEDPTWK